MEIESSKYIKEETRWRIIGFIESGKTKIEAAQVFGYAPSTIGRLWQKHRETGDVKDLARSGRPKTIHSAKKEEVINMLGEEHSSAKRISKEAHISTTSVYNIAHEAGFS